MKRTSVYNYIVALLLLIAIQLSAYGQAVVHISKEMVSLDGKPYYIHIVEKGQTLYSIAKAYHITTETLMKENRSSVYGLSEGDPLKIPVVDFEETVTPVQKDNDKFIYHTLQRGETIFALSRMYNLPEDKIIESNPGVSIFDLPVGSVIAVPRKEFREQTIDFKTDNEGFKLHAVKRGESLADIARQYDLSIREIRNANHKLMFPKTGDYIRIPVDNVAFEIDPSVTEDVVDSTLLEDENITLLFDGSIADFTPIDNLDGSVKVALLLPLYLESNRQRTYIDSSQYNSAGKKIYKTIKRPDEWIYPRSENFVEYYEGVLLAIDKLRSKGLSVDLSVFDTSGDSLVVANLINTGSLSDADLILGPVYSYNVDQVSDYAKRYRIPVVSPLASRNRDVLRSNPYLFKVQPSKEIVEEAMANVISDYYNYNLVFVHSDTAWSEDLSIKFKNNIYRKLRYVVPLDKVNFREVFFTSRSAYSDTINIIDHALRKDIPNLIIIASDDEAVMSEVVVNVHSLLRNYRIEVIGYPDLRWIDNLDPIYYYELGAMMFTPNWVDYDQPDVKDFIKNYRAKFNMEPPERSYAWQSYDISLFFISGIALNGSQFKYQPRRHKPDLLQVDYNFVRTGLTNGYENSRLFLIKFTPGLKVEFPRFNNPDNYRE